MANLIFFIALLVLLQAIISGAAWLSDANATFYGDIQGGETMQGACGYGDLFKQGYGLETTALSTALFNDGYACGACFEIVCVNQPNWSYCKKGAGSIRVTATNFCPPNYGEGSGHWCNPPYKHFDLSMKMFTTIAEYKAGIVPIYYRRVPCRKQGGVKFELKGNPYWLLVLVYNVGNAGDVSGVRIKGSNTGWLTMSRNWGQNWNIGVNLVGQSLSFMVTASDGKTLEFDQVAPSNWQFGLSYEGKLNF
ncbi:Expansin-A23 [Stylosanthes scabra]|uniref:Expansin n=1 Tax=Stylosanthes scabra TaxID=79078 RepID=A0ABU6RD30_9FABA|nr:Expansin-A23 [Stylosanthes scabra]